jgi:alginate O-acetyltransferase complex protein AlgI
MVFSSLIFLFCFLPAALALYFLCPPRGRNAVATAASVAFFAWGAPRFVFVLLAACAFNYAVGEGLVRGAASERGRRRRLAAAAVLNLGLLAYFKYANFAVEQFNALCAAWGFAPAAWTHVALPIGISFFTFQMLSYLVDVYRGRAEPARTFDRYLLYVFLFPQLIAGPIVRYRDVAEQIERRDHDSETFLDGAWRLVLGLAKKVLLANPAGRLADMAFSGAGPADATAAWAGLFAYSLQIYFDFSGYSDMAIGMGRMMGFRFLENFDFPYSSASVTEFWRRWHISLSSFMRDYLYVPLGGNRVSPGRMYVNLWIVFLLSGFWHGAAWNFVVWGACHGLMLSVERLVATRLGRWPVPRAVGVPLTFLLVTLAWVFFRSDSLAAATHYFAVLGSGPSAGAATAGARAFGAALADPRNVTVLAVGTLAAFAPALGLRGLVHEWSVSDGRRWLAPRLLARGAVTAVLLCLAAMALAAGGFNPFIYFRF